MQLIIIHLLKYLLLTKFVTSLPIEMQYREPEPCLYLQVLMERGAPQERLLIYVS